jgi:hypothetical protein
MNKNILKFDIKNFPSDVITLIYSFGYPEYKEHMKEVCYQLTNYTGTGLVQYNLNLLRQDYYNVHDSYVTCMVDYLIHAVNNEVLEDLFIQCTRCYCCSKHCHNRPTNYYGDEVSIGENFETSEQCHCNCRQLARSIKRSKSVYRRKKIYASMTTFNIQFIPQRIKLNSC